MTSTVARLRRLHPGWILAVLDVIGLGIALYLSAVELGGGVPYCGPLHGCETVAQSQYSRIAGIPVAVYGVGLSLVLLTLALAWIRSDRPGLLDLHYGLSLVGVIFEIYFLALQLFVRLPAGGVEDHDPSRIGRIPTLSSYFGVKSQPWTDRSAGEGRNGPVARPPARRIPAPGFPGKVRRARPSLE